MTTDELKRLKALADAATPGPWDDDGDAQSWDGEAYAQSWVETKTGRWYQVEPETGAAMAQQGADAAFIAAARTAVPALVDEVERLTAALTKARAGCPEHGWPSDDHEAQLRRAERERCAKVADDYAKRAWAAQNAAQPAAVAAEHLAQAFRALPDE